jgi:hypothetical protein
MKPFIRGLKQFEHLILAIAGLVTIIICCKLSHSDVADAIAFICVGSSGGAAACTVFKKELSNSEEPKQ